MANKQELTGKRIAILVTDGFEQVELTGPQKSLESAGATTEIVSPKSGSVQGMNHDEKGEMFEVDVELNDANADNYDALLLPGGVANPDSLRVEPRAVAFVKAFVDAGKPIAAICHGPWTLIETGVTADRKMTSWPSLKTDLINSGAKWEDSEVVTDRGLVTSRKPDDIPAFNRAMVEEFAEGSHGPGLSRKSQSAVGT